ncbi:MAG: tetratricopeptide repeat protein [Oscillospiraceae bacterium]|nr:tetratricopeptide repeat protein [Oscillospiraceae bacterium]
MGFPESRIISAKRLSQMMKDLSESSERFCFILGSGASVESGIPSGSTLEMQWMDCLMGKMEDRGMPAMDAGETREIAGTLYAEKAIEHNFGEIEAAWLRAKKENKPIPSEYYFDIYKLRFHSNPRQGYNYLEKIMEQCDPSLGYHTLAKLLAENSLHNLVITTNFDSLVEDALFLYTDKRPLVVSHESLADYMEANIRRPIIAKVHRGLMYAPLNSPENLQELKPEWQRALSQAFSIYTPIVIGYAGGDHSLMSFLEKETTSIRGSIYWCYRGKRSRAGLPGENIQSLVANHNGYFVAIDGFDALMVEIGKTMYSDAIRPGLTKDKLQKKLDERLRNYNAQWDKLNENQEMQKALQEMNAAEQKEEKQREKEELLTAQDYFRRGFRASSEGHTQEAVKEYSKAIELDPSFASAYHNRGILYNNLGEQQKALDDYNKAIELDPSYAFAYNGRGNVYRGFGERQKALDDYNKAIELDPSFAYAYNGRGNVYSDLGEQQKALDDYNKAIELDSSYAHAYNGRGNVYSDLGEQQKALEDYNKAIELDLNYKFAYRNRGLLYSKLGNLEAAVKDYTQAIQLDPKYKNAYLNRADAYSALGQESLAEADRKAAAEL